MVGCWFLGKAWAFCFIAIGLFHTEPFLADSVADERKKLDGFMLFNTGSPQDMKKSATIIGNKNVEGLQPEHKYNVRQSLAWDSAFFTSPGVLEPEELFQTMNYQSMDNAVHILRHEEEILLPSESLESESESRFDKCDLRKSLAWDNAFFTNAGVLDPEELSIVNKGFKKHETRLPRIQEDVWRSTESNSTIDSGGSSLSSLEIDLFEDIRSSIHKLTDKSDVENSSLKLLRGEDNQNFHTKCTPSSLVKEYIPAASKKLDASSRTRMKDMPMTRRFSIKAHRVEKSKGSSVSVPSQKQLASGSGENNSLSSLKPPKILDRAKNTSTASAKRASLVANVVKVGVAKAASGQCLTRTRNPNPGDSCSVTCNSAPSPKSSSGSPVASHDSTIYCSPNNGFCNTPSHSACKSHLDSSGKKMDSSHANFSAKGSTFRAPLRCTTRSKGELGSSDHPASSLSTPKSSSCTSPDSSLDGWSSESPTSVNQRCNNSKAFMGCTGKQVTPESNSSRHSALEKQMDNPSCTGHGSQETRPPNQRGKKILLGTGSLSSSFQENNKPSGLRLPSPKIGFFDAETSSLSTTDGFPQLHSDKQSSESRVGNGSNTPNGAANRTRYGKPHSSRTLTGTRKQNGYGQAFRNRPTHQVPATEGSTGNCYPVTCKREDGWPPKASWKDCLGTEKMGSKNDDGAEFGICYGSKAQNKGNKGSVGTSMGAMQVETVLQRANKKHLKEYELQNGKFPGDNLRHYSDKENIFRSKDEVDDLSRHVGAFDLGNDVVTELKANKISSKGQSGILNSETNDSPPHLSSAEPFYRENDNFLRILSKE
ncbi:hypothetical protein FNV43_RR24952 [Rhamnella rubrinervis]|uniref:Uncharacterized protein n=1 Tax=Rhamnella rubrinervis TaxID=2594499 RepID=A0A8K0DTK9_9ROSA|nr:hypothetical protein FNV43_RR24952 [Rhamnella rubrinervis]